MIKISTPVNGYNGIDCGVRFENGTAEVETLEQHVYNWFKSHGYIVEGELESTETTPEANPETENKPKTKTELLEEAKELGIENIKGKATNAEIEKLIADKKAELEALESSDPEASNPEDGEENGESTETTPEANPETGEQGSEDSKGGE